MKKTQMTPDEDLNIANLMVVFHKEMQKLREQLNKKKGFVCRYCGKQALKPHGGKCPHSPHANHTHEFIGAVVDLN